MQTHHLVPLTTQLLDYANPSPKLWLTFSLKTNHHKLLSNLSNMISTHIQTLLWNQTIITGIAWIKDEANYNMHNLWNA